MVTERLDAIFLSRIPADLRPQCGDQLEQELAELVARARTEAPGVDVAPAAFVAHVADRAAFDGDGRPRLQSLRAGDLWIASGCVVGIASAVEAFEIRFAPEIRGALQRTFEPALAEQAELRLRERLFLVADDSAPRLASYSGRGDLRSWLRAAAVRTAIDLMRGRREIPVAPDALASLGVADDPLLGSLKQRYRDEFRSAFDEAVATLTDRERTLLRYRFVDELSADEIAALYRVHRATVTRWLAAIREGLFEATRSRLMTRLAITPDETDSVLRLIDSQLDVSIGGIMR